MSASPARQNDGGRNDDAGSGGSSERPASEATINGFGTVDDPVTLELPIEAYLPSGEQLRAYATAQQILVNQCLAEFGFEPDRLPGAFNADDELATSFTSGRYFISNLENAQSYGYHTSLTPAFVRAEERRQQRLAEAEASRPDERTAAARALVTMGVDIRTGEPAADLSLDGGVIPEGGCFAEANRDLAGGDHGLGRADLPNQLQFDAWEQSRSDPRVVRVFADWSACMAGQGFSYVDPIEANNAAEWSADAPSARELTTATADVTCKQQHNVVGVWHGVEVEIQNQMIEANAAELTEVADQLDDVLAAVAEVVARGGR